MTKQTAARQENKRNNCTDATRRVARIALYSCETNNLMLVFFCQLEAPITTIHGLRKDIAQRLSNIVAASLYLFFRVRP